MLFYSGTYRVSCVLFVKEGWKSNHSNIGNDGDHAPYVFVGHVREKRSAFGNYFETVYTGDIFKAEIPAVSNTK